MLLISAQARGKDERAPRKCRDVDSGCVYQKVISLRCAAAVGSRAFLTVHAGCQG
jgi:hypothetical protein